MVKVVIQSSRFSSVRKFASIDWLLLPYSFLPLNRFQEPVCDLKLTFPPRPPSGGLVVGG